MRHIIFDTETTGLDNEADRIIEFGGIELDNHFPTGRSFHVYIRPGERKVHPEALAIHGITDEFLLDQPDFAAIVEDLTAFIEGAHLVAHNASFDIGFLNAELARLALPAILPEIVVDSLALARRRHPMGPNSLDALCRRYGIDNAHRTKHGALLDAELLAEVFIEMNGGRQAALGLVHAADFDGAAENGTAGAAEIGRPQALAPRITEAERLAHAALVTRLGENAIWARYSR
ncbi:DNA polymerase III subunit epsilon [Pararhizobium mangrovi]|uniref:DNA polymerase III subunit epsilon n=1 Tax=Pararhizobium mangrovi TaxID=2590452 RepID=A0A506U1W4_9HYPH|nr:DNA polymerase III subunit epsilon [Pararhizobium mangrovi]TPW27261.1 DNA polymerase III subunit epsilon [Pararhizobium mangrovi]